MALVEHTAPEDSDMAKGQKRSGREAKKPKAAKKPAPMAASPFTRVPTPKAPVRGREGS